MELLTLTILVTQIFQSPQIRAIVLSQTGNTIEMVKQWFQVKD